VACGVWRVTRDVCNFFHQGAAFALAFDQQAEKLRAAAAAAAAAEAAATSAAAAASASTAGSEPPKKKIFLSLKRSGSSGSNDS
jgi:hypothetical protein